MIATVQELVTAARQVPVAFQPREGHKNVATGGASQRRFAVATRNPWVGVSSVHRPGGATETPSAVQTSAAPHGAFRVQGIRFHGFRSAAKPATLHPWLQPFAPCGAEIYYRQHVSTVFNYDQPAAASTR